MESGRFQVASRPAAYARTTMESRARSSSSNDSSSGASFSSGESSSGGSRSSNSGGKHDYGHYHYRQSVASDPFRYENGLGSISSMASLPVENNNNDRNPDLLPASESGLAASTSSLSSLSTSRSAPDDALTMQQPQPRRASNATDIDSSTLPDHVQALHDYSATSLGSNVCLSFSAGQLIKVLNKDPSGWWDGELDGKRGWFPSNYVIEDGDVPKLTADDDDDDEGAPSANAHFKPSPRTSSIDAVYVNKESLLIAPSSPASHGSPSGEPNGSRDRPPSVAVDAADKSNHITSTISRAIALMQTAVEAHRMVHYQPATTCLIASVKSVLSATDCLAKESTILRNHVVLARERRQVLSSLAGLVTQAKAASNSDLSETSREAAAHTMLQLANRVLHSVERFLQIAATCGIQVSSNIEDESEDPSFQQILTMDTVSTPSLDACFQFCSEPAEETSPCTGEGSLFKVSSSGKALHKATSLSDMKTRRKASSASSTSRNSGISIAPGSSASPYDFLTRPPSPSPLPKNQLVQAAIHRRPSIPAVYTPTQPSPSWHPNDSVSSNRSSFSLSSSGPLTPADNDMPQQPVDIYRAMSLIHDQILSNIAALIGHVHAHSRASHSSSYAYLIDIIQEIIERVKESIVIADAISIHPNLQFLVRDMKALVKQREALYVATTGLVTAARVVTSPIAGTSPSSFKEETKLSEQEEEEEKSKLIKTATVLLRSSADCVNAARPLLLRKGLDTITFTIDLLQVERSASPAARTSTSSDSVMDEDATLQASDIAAVTVDDGNRSGQKARHTVSMLGRKATSLKCLRNRYENDGEATSLNPVLGEDEESDYDSVKRIAAWRMRQRGQQRDSEQTSSARSSVNLSRSSESSDDSRNRFSSSLSDRRGVRTPAQLQIRTQASHLQSRPPSFGSMSAASTVTSLRDKAGTPAPTSAQLVGMNTVRKSSENSPTIISVKPGRATMSRDESSRGSASSTATSSLRSNYSEAGTADTSPRSSILIPSPVDEKADRQLADGYQRRPSRPDFITRTRSGSTPDRVAALRVSEGVSQHLPPPLSPRVPILPNAVDGHSSRQWFLERDYQPEECSFNADGNITGGTFRCLFERMTLHDQTIDPNFSKTFFLTFRMFTTPMELTEALIGRFTISLPSKPALTEAEVLLWQDQKLTPVRLRVYNTFKTWLESYWHPETDAVVLDQLIAFTREAMMPVMAGAAQRLLDLVQTRSHLTTSNGSDRPGVLTRMASAEKLKAGKPIGDGQPPGIATFPGPLLSLPPHPITSKSLMTALRSPMCTINSIHEFDPTELARQLTIMENRLFCSIEPAELLSEEFGKKSHARGSRIKMMSSVSTRITGWVADIILSEQDAKKRTALLKFFIKLNERLLNLQNYNTMMAVVAALGSSTISRLKRTWDGLSNKYAMLWERQQKLVEHSRNYAQYRAAIRTAIIPCLPFLGLYLTDITFCRDGNPQYRASPLDPNLRLINFDRYVKIAKIVDDLQRFQQPYNLIEIPEVQSYLHLCLSNVANDGDHHDLYRRSLLVEPREKNAEAGPHSTSNPREIFNWRL